MEILWSSTKPEPNELVRDENIDEETKFKFKFCLWHKLEC